MSYIINIEKKWISDATDFAEKSISTNINKYISRNQPNIKKGMNDNRVGKIGEEVVYNYLVKIMPEITKPDYIVYKVKNKSWEKDLRDIATNVKIGVKTQTKQSAERYGQSWVFQNEDKGINGNDKIDIENYIAFVLIDLDNKVGMIQGIVKVPWLHEKELFKPMKLAYLQNNKKAVYYDDLMKYENELWQL